MNIYIYIPTYHIFTAAKKWQKTEPFAWMAPSWQCRRQSVPSDPPTMLEDHPTNCEVRGLKVYVCVCININIYIYVCVHLCMCIYIHTYVHTLHYITLHLHYITLHNIKLHCITLHYILTLHYIALHCIALQLHCITLRYITLHCITLHYIHTIYICNGKWVGKLLLSIFNAVMVIHCDLSPRREWSMGDVMTQIWMG